MASASLPTGDKRSTAATVLAYIPDTERPSFLKSLIGTLRTTEYSSIDFVASLVVQYDHDQSTSEFLLFLEQVVRTENIQCVVSIARQHTQLGNELLERIADCIAKDKSSVAEMGLDGNIVQSYLRFAKSIVFHLQVGPVQSNLFRCCLDLLSASDKNTCTCARDVVFAFLSAHGNEPLRDNIQSESYHIWETVQELSDSETKNFNTLTGYSVWLRWMLSDYQPAADILASQEYWQLLLKGLRYGDTERRKTCLNIVKLSVSADAAAVSETERQHYDRYCTIFETIVLGRYINQVQDCEKDLNSLVSDEIMKPRWLFALLASALDPRIQESNRKFIGKWVMQSSLTATKEFLSFFENDFLPWATQGQHFVSSLKERNGAMRCLHGNRLTLLIQKLRHGSPNGALLTDTIVNMIQRKSNSIFPYAAVYMLEGLGDSLQEKHMNRYGELRRAPDVARDYIISKMSKDESAKQVAPTISRKKALEQSAIEKCLAFDPETDDVNEIWSDLEYLEYPKSVLMIIPETIFQSKLIQRAAKDPELATVVSEKLHALQTMSETKSFLMPPLVHTIRETVLTTPSTVDVLDIAELIIRIADRPPRPTVDLMLEEAIIPLTPFSYEHYFGKSLSLGFATLLDFMSRLWDHDSLLKHMMLRIIGQWKDQKVPPPTVSTWKTTLQLQVLLLCAERLPYQTLTEHARILDDLLYILSIEPLPRYRYLLEWIIARWIEQESCQNTVLNELRARDHHSNPKLLASLMKIGVVLACGKISRRRHARRRSDRV